MKKLKIITICALVCSIGAIFMSGASATSTSQEDIEGLISDQNNIVDCKDTKNKVLAFLGKKDINIEYKGVMSTCSGDMILFESEDEKLYVNSQTKSVEGVIFYKSLENSTEVQLNKEKAREIAEEYARSKYRAFSHKKMQLLRSDLLDHGDAGKEYLFVWSEIVDGILTPNYVSVSINPNTADVISYHGIERALEVGLKPEISREDAIKTAIAQFKEIEVSNVDVQLAVMYPEQDEQRLTWIVNVDGKDNGTFAQGGQVLVDAVTCEVVLVDPYL
ncbi:hypothetical protein RJ40_01435 [Methanofollis aquaemaris]|uniref:YcdB/YcdC repeated domain-containing protein n=1 Tax=Methanofollis aquaemaris TaxID=126734 RepID=A0A8A3S2V6_9EURY|nr:YcdB/YcdC domain-containing protein [Methanofollis aquaemaris]QSZ66253.1 hypothetical protein RJ40_01435 [Methanofollis aquaemaris]